MDLGDLKWYAAATVMAYFLSHTHPVVCLVSVLGVLSDHVHLL